MLRGASFAFRKEVVRTSYRRNFGTTLAISSVLVPYCMGAIIGGIASGRVPAGGQAGDPVHSWINPTSVLGGVLAVAAVGSVVIGWGVAQWPYILPTTLTVSAAASPSGTLATVLVATGLAILLVLPGLTLL